MNEEYLLGAFNSFGGQEKLKVDFNTWMSKIKDNDDYKQGMFNNFGGQEKLGASYDDWNNKVFGLKKKETTQSDTEVTKSDSFTPTKSTSSDSEGVINEEELFGKPDPNLQKFTPKTDLVSKEDEDAVVNYIQDQEDEYIEQSKSLKEIIRYPELSNEKALLKKELESRPIMQDNSDITNRISEIENIIKAPKKSFRKGLQEKEAKIDSQIAELEQKDYQLGANGNFINSSGTYQDLKKQKEIVAQNIKNENKLLKKLTTDRTIGEDFRDATLKTLTYGLIPEKYIKKLTPDNETIKLNEKVEEELLIKLEEDTKTKQKLLYGGNDRNLLSLNEKENLIKEAKVKVFKKEKENIKNSLSELKDKYSKTEDSIERQKIEKEYNDLIEKSYNLSGTYNIDIAKGQIKNIFKKTTEKEEYREKLKDQKTLDVGSTFLNGFGNIIGDYLTSGASLVASLGDATFGDKNYGLFDALGDTAFQLSDLNLLPSSEQESGRLFNDNYEFTPSAYSIGKAFSNTAPFSIALIMDLKGGDAKGVYNKLGKYISPKNLDKANELSKSINMAKRAYQITLTDNLNEAKELGLDGGKAFVYQQAVSTITGAVSLINPDFKFFNTSAGKIALQNFSGSLKSAVNKKAIVKTTQNFIKDIAKEVGEEELEFALTEITSIGLVEGYQSKFKDIQHHKDLIANTIAGTGVFAGVGLRSNYKKTKKEFYKDLTDNFEPVNNQLDELLSIATDEKIISALEESKELLGNVSEAINKSPENVTSNQIDLLIEKKKIINEMKSMDDSFHPKYKEQIEAINEKIRKDSGVEEESFKSTVTPQTKEFTDALGESEDISNVAQGVSKVNINGADVSFKSEGDKIILESISVPEENRGQGNAKKALEKITQLADEKGVEIELTVKPLDDTTNNEGLVKLYENNGFETTSGNKMVRKPKVEKLPETKRRLLSDGKEEITYYLKNEDGSIDEVVAVRNKYREETEEEKSRREEIYKKIEEYSDIIDAEFKKGVDKAEIDIIDKAEKEIDLLTKEKNEILVSTGIRDTEISRKPYKQPIKETVNEQTEKTAEKTEKPKVETTTPETEVESEKEVGSDVIQKTSSIKTDFSDAKPTIGKNVLNNETQTQGDTSTDKNIQPGTIKDDSKKESKSVQPTTKPKSDKKSTKVKVDDVTYNVSVTEEGLEITSNKKGKLTSTEKNKATDAYINSIDYTKGKKVDFEGRESATEEDQSDIISSESENAIEIIEEIKKVEERDAETTKIEEDTIDDAIAGALATHALTQDSKKEVTDLGSFYTNVGNRRNKDRKSIDEIRQIAETNSGQSVSFQDVLNFLENNQSIRDYKESKETSNITLNNLKARFKEITGLNPNNANYTKVLNSKNNDSKRVGEKTRTVAKRLLQAENIDQSVLDDFSRMDINYNPQKRDEVIQKGDEIIEKLGIDNAFNLAQAGQIRGGVKTYIEVKYSEEINRQLNEALANNDLDKAERLKSEFEKFWTEFARERTFSGQENQFLAEIYKDSDLRFNVDFIIEKLEKQHGKEFPAFLVARLRKQKEQLIKQQKALDDLKKKIGSKDEINAFKNIQETYKKERNKPSKSSLRKASKILRSAKFTSFMADMETLNTNPIGETFKFVWDGAIETLAFALDQQANINEALEQVYNQIKNSDWYNNLTKKNQKIADKKIKLGIDSYLSESIVIPTKEIEVGEDNEIKIPPQILYDFIADGVDNINDLVAKVKEIVEQDYPNVTDREVRDAITGYGKKINENGNMLRKKLGSLKIDGTQLSKLEDLDMGKLPKKKRKGTEYTELQKKNIREIQRKMREIPLDDSIDKEAYYKSALEGYKTRLEGQIKELQEAIDKNEQIVTKGNKLQLDTKAEQLKEELSALRKEYNETFKDTPLSNQRRVESVRSRKENQLKKLRERLERLKLDKAEDVKDTKKITSPEIELLNEQISKINEEYSQVLADIGIAEQKRIERKRKYLKTREEYYRDRLKRKDFAKNRPRPLVSNDALLEEEVKLIEIKKKYDDALLEYEESLKSDTEKALDKLLDLWNVPKGLKASIDVSAPFRQGAMLGSRNHKQFQRAMIEMHKSFNKKGFKESMAKIETHELYPLMIKAGLELTEVDGGVNKAEERFISNMVKTEIKIKGKNVNIAGMGLDFSERTYTAFLNNLRAEVFIKNAELMKESGITQENDPQAYKDLAKLVNFASGRGALGKDETINKLLNAVFFSPRMITAMGGMLKLASGYKTSPYVRKEAQKTLASFVAYQFIMKGMLGLTYAGLQGLFSDEEEEIENAFPWEMFDPRSTDFGKLKIGDTRYQTAVGWEILIRTLVRVVTGEEVRDDETMNAIKMIKGEKRYKGKLKVLNESYKESALDPLLSFFYNKYSPSARYLASVITDKNPSDSFKDGGFKEATPLEHTESLTVPLTIGGLWDDSQDPETPAIKVLFNFALNLYGIGSQTYGRK